MLFSDRKTHFLLEKLIKIAFLHQNLFYIPKSEYNLNYISVFVFEIRSLFEAQFCKCKRLRILFRKAARKTLKRFCTANGSAFRTYRKPSRLGNVISRESIELFIRQE